MIEIINNGNLFDSQCQALVNAVNTVGVMGKGLAWEFKCRYPEMFIEYQRACKNNEIDIGKLHIYTYLNDGENFFIINFPTKTHWRYRSELEYIQKGLVDLQKFLFHQHIESIAIPALGTGLGGLSKEDVKKEIEQFAEGNPDLLIKYYQ